MHLVACHDVPCLHETLLFFIDFWFNNRWRRQYNQGLTVPFLSEFIIFILLFILSLIKKLIFRYAVKFILCISQHILSMALKLALWNDCNSILFLKGSLSFDFDEKCPKITIMFARTSWIDTKKLCKNKYKKTNFLYFYFWI